MITIKRYVAYYIAALCASIFSDSILIHNTTDLSLYGRFYYVHQFKEKVKCCSQPFLLKAGADDTVERPDFKLGYDRVIALSSQKADLKKRLSSIELQKLPNHHVGVMHGKDFYISQDVMGIQVADQWDNPFLDAIDGADEWAIRQFEKIDEAVEVVVSDKLKNALQVALPAFNTKKYQQEKSVVAQVRKSNDLCDGEKKAIAARLVRVRDAIEQKLGPIEYVPKIAVVTSGGGYRAMFGTLGFLSGAEQAGLLDTVLWSVGLSGSTWAYNAWHAFASEDPQNCSICHFKDSFYDQVTDKRLTWPLMTFSEAEIFAQMMTTELLDRQPNTLVNIFGGLLANRLLVGFGDERHLQYLSSQQERMESGAVPISISTAVKGDDAREIDPLDWYEFTPWEIGSSWLGMYVPTWAFGRRFEHGSSLDDDAEKSLGYMLGLFGSAFALTLDEAYSFLKDSIKSSLVKALVRELLETRFAQKRLCWAEVHNFTKGMSGSVLADDTHLKMVDAGIEFGLPYPPVSGEREGRSPDIIIFLDISSTVHQAENGLKDVQAYALRAQCSLPPIDVTEVDTRSISVFKSEDRPDLPVLIYLPRINDSSLHYLFDTPDFARFKGLLSGFDIEKSIKNDFANTYNFKYSRNEIDAVSGLCEFNMLANADTIWREIAAVVSRKR